MIRRRSGAHGRGIALSSLASRTWFPIQRRKRDGGVVLIGRIQWTGRMILIRRIEGIAGAILVRGVGRIAGIVAIRRIERAVRIVLVGWIERIIRHVLACWIEDIVVALVTLVESHLGVASRTPQEERHRNSHPISHGLPVRGSRAASVA